jgi:hypothetical protein
MPEWTSRSGGRAPSVLSRVLPDPKICRTSPIGSIKAIGLCFVNPPGACPYAKDYGEGYFCTCPRWKSFHRPAKYKAM